MVGRLAASQIAAASLASFLLAIEKLESKLDMYLFPTKKQRVYPLGKFLVLCSVLNSENIRTNKQIVKKVKETVSDPYYRKWLSVQYEI